MDFEIFDFHTHPFIYEKENICDHIKYCNMSMERTKSELLDLGISHIAGSVVSYYEDKACISPKRMIELNDMALKLRKIYGDFYIPGFHICPMHIEESKKEIKRMHENGVNLIGELVPYLHNWEEGYESDKLSEIIDYATEYNMIISFHSQNEDGMDKMVREHPNTIFVAAHPGERKQFERHLQRMQMSKNYYLDLSGYGIFRYGMLRHGIDEMGKERFIFGSDYPTCSPAMYIGGVVLDKQISDIEKEYIMSKNAKKLLGVK